MSAFAALDTRKLGLVVCRKDKTLYNFATQGWDAIPTNGVPDASHVQPLGAFTTTGPLASQQFIDLPDVVTQTPGIWVAVMALDANGVPTSQVDCYGGPPSTFTPMGLIGTWAKA